jgi:hypothetical protein
MGVPETFIIDQRHHPRDYYRRVTDETDSLQVLTKLLNVTPKAADAQQSDRGAKKG